MSRCKQKCQMSYGDAVNTSWYNWSKTCVHNFCNADGMKCNDSGCRVYEKGFYFCCNANDKSCKYDSSDAKRRAADTPEKCRRANNAIWFNYVSPLKAQRECGEGTYSFSTSRALRTHYCFLGPEAKRGANGDKFKFIEGHEQYFCVNTTKNTCKPGDNIAYYR